MSTIAITFTTQPLDDGQEVPGFIRFDLTIDGVVYEITEVLWPFPSSYGFFTYFPWNGNQSESDATQALYYQQAFIRDHTNKGGTGNLSTSLVGNVLTITAAKGVFSNFLYSGDYLIMSHDTDNSLQDVPKTFSYSEDGTGDCDNIDYTADSATGGTAPYRLFANGSNIFTGWDGATQQSFQLSRTLNYTGGLYDSLGALIKSFSEVTIKKLEPSDFKAYMTYYEGYGYSDVKIETVVPRPGTTPLEYALDDGPWQSSNIFGGILTGLHVFKVRDKFGCSISKNFEIYDSTSIEPEEREVYFTVSEYNSLSFYRDDRHGVSVRKNYGNTPSFKEAVGIPKTARFCFPMTSSIATKFNSSYPLHNVTLHKWDGTKQDIPFLMIQENLGVTERVDCKLFPIQEVLSTIEGGSVVINNGIGIYFDGGNKYEPQTSTIIDDSPYTSGLPPWAKKGNNVAVQGLGTFEILDTELYNEDRGVTYFRIEGTLTEQAGIIEAKFDRHPYNVFRFDFDMEDVHAQGNYIKIEPGFDVDGTFMIDRKNLHKSEPFFVLLDTSKYLKIAWHAFRNLGEMIFIDNMESEMWVKGKIRPFPANNSEFDDGDDQARSIDQESYLRMRATIPVMTPKQWRKFDLVGAIGSRGEIFIEDMKLIKIKGIDHDELGDTNISNITCEFAYSGEGPNEGQQDPVLDVTTGATGTGTTGKNPVINYQIEGYRLITEEGELINVDGYFVEVD